MVAAVNEHEPRTLRRVIFAVYGAEAEAAFTSVL
jgi:hypothetical protein